MIMLDEAQDISNGMADIVLGHTSSRIIIVGDPHQVSQSVNRYTLFYSEAKDTIFGDEIEGFIENRVCKMCVDGLHFVFPRDI